MDVEITLINLNKLVVVHIPFDKMYSHLSYNHALIENFNLPAGFKVVRSHTDEQSRIFSFIIHHPSFAIVGDGEVIPEFKKSGS